MANEVKRMRYFDGLFLKQDEFNLEQDYHIRMRRLHNGALFDWGVIKGLEVQAGPGVKEVTVTQGLALSRITVNDEELGQEIILPEDTALDLSSYAANATVYISVAYLDEKADVVEEKGGTEEIHWWEKAVLSHASTEPGNKQENIILAKVKMKADGTVDSGSILYAEGGTAIRMYAALTVAGGLNVGGTTDPGQDNLLVEGRCTIKGDLIVEGQTTTVNTQNLVVEDNIITVNKGTPQNQSGLEVYRGGLAEAQLIWDETTDKWKAGIKGSLVDLAYGANAGGLTDHSVADGLHRHSKLVSANGLVDPVVSVDNAGNVGVGISSPTQKLDVNGTVRAGSFIGNGANLTALNGSQITSGVVGQAYIDPLIARKSDVGDVAGLRTEVIDARGIKANLGNRLDESLTAGGQLRQHIVGPDQLTTDLANKVNGALQPNTYDFTRRAQATVAFTQLNGNNAQQTLTLGFRPKFIWAIGYGKAVLAGAWFGVNAHGYADLHGGILMMGTSATIHRIATAPYWLQDCANSVALIRAYFVDQTVAPRRESDLSIRILQVSDTGLVLQFLRIDPSTTGGTTGTPAQTLQNFTISVQLYCFG
jgi:hypothetical protein